MARPIATVLLCLLVLPAPGQVPDIKRSDRINAQGVMVEDRIRYLRRVVIAPEEIVDDVVCIACSVDVRGRVTGDLVVIGGNVTITGAAYQDVIIVVGDLEVRSGAVTGDELSVQGGRVEIAPGARVAHPPEMTPLPGLGWLPGPWRLATLLFVMLGTLQLLGAIVAYPFLRRSRYEATAASLFARPWRAILGGGAAMVVFVALVALASELPMWTAVAFGLAAGVAGFILFRRYQETVEPGRRRMPRLSWVGSAGLALMALLIVALGFQSDAEDWLVFAVLVLFFAVAGLGYGALGLLLGRFFMPGISTFAAVLLGSLALTLLHLLPVLNVIIGLAVLLTALGAALLTRMGARPA